MVTYGQWVSRTTADVNDVARKLAPLWRRALGVEEREQLLQMAENSSRSCDPIFVWIFCADCEMR